MSGCGLVAPGWSSQKELCLLSLDGGGVRGLSSLMILKNLMEVINPRNPPSPCEYFDMIGGTSTGGLIALMLGRLRMSVDECIDVYETMSKEVFSKTHRFPVQTLHPRQTQGRFDHGALERHVKLLLERRGLHPDTLFDDELEEGSCKTFVCATSQKTSRPAILSSYNNSRRGMDLLKITKIWEAARATSAATTFFEPITIGDETFCDGATGVNNPVWRMFDEAGDVFSDRQSLKDEDIRCIVSIGTGVRPFTSFGPAVDDVARGLKDIATESEETADSFQRNKSWLFDSKRAFRFNVSPGLENVSLEEHEKFGDIKTVTRHYVQTPLVHDQIKHCVKSLTQRVWVERLRRDLIKFISPSVTTLNDDEHVALNEMQWLIHTRTYQVWANGESEIIWYQQRTESSDEARKNTGAAVAYRSFSSYPSFVGEELGVGPDLKRVLYHQCDRRQPGYDHDPDAPYCTSPEGVVLSLICQCLLIDQENIESFDRRLMEFHKESRVALQKALDGRLHLRITDLFNILTQAMQGYVLHVPVVLDNIHLLQGDSSPTFWTTFKSFMNRMRSGQPDNSMSAFLSGRKLRSHEDYLHGIPTVGDETERTECLSSLHFPEWNARRIQVAAAQSGTHEWLWSHDQYKKWERESAAILWIEGKAGSGKSVLAKSIQRRLYAGMAHSIADSEHSPDDSRSDNIAAVPEKKLVADWFYSTRLHKVGMAPLSLLRSILYQLLQQNSKLFDIFAHVYRRKPASDEHEWTIPECKKILEAISKHGTSVICIIDALDEAAETVLEPDGTATMGQRSDTIMNMLRGLGSVSEDLKMKFLVLSRPDDQVEKDFSKVRKSTFRAYKIVLEHENQKDIEVIIDKGLSSLRIACIAPESDYESEAGDPRHERRYRGLPQRSRSLSSAQQEAMNEVEEYLSTNAKGVILWVNLVIGELIDLARDRMSLPDLQIHAKRLPRGLVGEEGFYGNFVKKLEEKTLNIPRVRSIFMLIHGSAMLGKPLLVNEMWEASAVPMEPTVAITSRQDPIESRRANVGSWTNYRRHLRSLCGGFVEVIHGPARTTTFKQRDIESEDVRPDDIVQFTHRTAKDFLQDEALSRQLYFSENQAIEHVKIIAQTYLKLSFPREKVQYGPQLKEWLTNSWVDNVMEYTNYLEDKILLRFSLSVLQKFYSEFPEFAYILESNTFILLHSRCNHLSIKIDRDTARMYPAINRASSIPEWGEMYDPSAAFKSHRAMALGESFRSACSRGLTTAVQNLLAICSLITEGPYSIRQHRESFTGFSYSAQNGALASAIAHNLESQVRILTRAHRHQAGLRNATLKDREGWPLERQYGPNRLDPFIKLAVLSGSVETVRYLFSDTEQYYSHNETVREFAVTSTNLRDELSRDAKAHGRSDDESVSSISDEHLVRLGILTPDTEWRRSLTSSDQNSCRKDSRQNTRTRSKPRRTRQQLRYAQLEDLCIRRARLYRGTASAYRVQGVKSEDVKLAISLITNEESDADDSGREKNNFRQVMQSDAYHRIYARNTMISHREIPTMNEWSHSSPSMSNSTSDEQGTSAERRKISRRASSIDNHYTYSFESDNYDNHREQYDSEQSYSKSSSDLDDGSYDTSAGKQKVRESTRRPDLSPPGRHRQIFRETAYQSEEDYYYHTGDYHSGQRTERRPLYQQVVPEVGGSVTNRTNSPEDLSERGYKPNRRRKPEQPTAYPAHDESLRRRNNLGSGSRHHPMREERCPRRDRTRENHCESPDEWRESPRARMARSRRDGHRHRAGEQESSDSGSVSGKPRSRLTRVFRGVVKSARFAKNISGL